jgi:hypothetical protein
MKIATRDECARTPKLHTIHTRTYTHTPYTHAHTHTIHTRTYIHTNLFVAFRADAPTANDHLLKHVQTKRTKERKKGKDGFASRASSICMYPHAPASAVAPTPTPTHTHTHTHTPHTKSNSTTASTLAHKHFLLSLSLTRAPTHTHSHLSNSATTSNNRTTTSTHAHLKPEHSGLVAPERKHCLRRIEKARGKR